MTFLIEYQGSNFTFIFIHFFSFSRGQNFLAESPQTFHSKNYTMVQMIYYVIKMALDFNSNSNSAEEIEPTVCIKGVKQFEQ